MRYEIDIPEDVGRRLEERAAQTGGDVVHLVQAAVVTFVRSGMVFRSPEGRMPDPAVGPADDAATFELPRPGAERSVPAITAPSGDRLPDAPNPS